MKQFISCDKCERNGSVSSHYGGVSMRLFITFLVLLLAMAGIVVLVIYFDKMLTWQVGILSLAIGAAIGLVTALWFG